MKKCVMCDKLERDTATSCSSCGGYLLPVEKKKAAPSGIMCTCPYCGRKNYSSQKTCFDCGVELPTVTGEEYSGDTLKMGEGQGLCLFVMAAMVIWNGYLSYWFGADEAHTFIPKIHPSSAFFFLLGRFGLTVFSLIVFIGLCGKQRWAGKISYYPFALSTTLLVVAELWDMFTWSGADRLRIYEHSSGVLWMVAAGLIGIGVLVDRYYKNNLECMVAQESEDDEW